MTQPARDVLTFGETMLRLSPPGRQRLAQAASLDVWVAGCESNVAAALCALGLSATWVSRLPDNPPGHRIEAALRAAGIDVSHVVWTPPSGRVGLFYAEAAAEPRAGMVVYDRAHSAASFLSPADLPDALFDTHRHLHVSGITPALSGSCAAAVADAIARAKARGRTVSLDTNYRAKLWSPEEAAAALAPLMASADILFCASGDAALLFGLSGDAASLRDHFGVPVAETVERIGSGDAFAAGFLAEYLRGASLEDALRMGTAAGALKRTILGDMLVATRADIEAVLARESRAAWR